MPWPARDKHGYQHYHDIHLADSSRAHLGDVHYYGQSADERAFNVILESLSYPGMTDRRDALAEAHKGTFDWTFLEGDTEFVSHRFVSGTGWEHDSVNKVKMNFGPWLRADSGGLFSVMGKPGAGKSTFMKSLASNNEIEKMLQSWSTGKDLVRADHCFWLLGGNVQKSYEGLLRSLCHSVICALLRDPGHPDSLAAVKEACGPRWTSVNKRSPWSREELKGLFCRLASLGTVRYFFVIDALDECEPQDALGELADEMLWISRMPHVKLCVSCRPWNVFVRKFDSAMTLRLDLLTYSDMAKYVEARLRSAEAEWDCQDDFRAETPLAKQFVYDIASAAEGVFLWIELVTKALCSELRKGSNVEKLQQLVSEFPADLDAYFHTLIFDRIGKTRRNIFDTAAALKLALEINRHEENHGTIVPFPVSFMNFWLLSQGYLQQGFSWTGYGNVAQIPNERMLKQTMSFLEETCKDLLIPIKSRSGDWDVDFLHRTVYDFLSDSHINRILEQNAPPHFSNANFIMELARLRCMCLLRQSHTACRPVRRTFDGILIAFQDADPRALCAKWQASSEELTIAQMQANCNCLGLDHVAEPGLKDRCLKLGLNKYLLEAVKHLPYQAMLDGSALELDLLGVFLHIPIIAGIQTASFSNQDTVRQALECGCDPNKSIGNWPYWRAGTRGTSDYIFSHGGNDALVASDEPQLMWCKRTNWEAWLGATYLHFQESSRATRPPELALPDIQTQKRRAGCMADLLLRYGANAHCTPCIADHETLPYDSDGSQPNACRRVTLDELLPLIIPTESLAHFTGLRAVCSGTLTISTLQRNQCRRAIRSFVVSERNLNSRVARMRQPSRGRAILDGRWEHEQGKFLAGLMGLRHVSDAVCLFCSWSNIDIGLITWCIDCRGMSYLCLKCCAVFSPEIPDLEPPCKAFASPDQVENLDHTSITVAHDIVRDDDARQNVDLALRYGASQAVAVLKEWYSRNTI